MDSHRLHQLHARVRQLEIRVRRRVVSSFAGTYKSAFKGSGLEFDEVRQYQYGDDVRAIDWNVTARNTHDVFVKVFREERQLTVWVLLDISGSQHFGPAGSRKLHVGLEIASLIGFAAQTNADRVGVIAFSDRIDYVLHPTQRHRQLLGALAHLLESTSETRQTSLRLALEFARRVQHRRSLVFVVSDFLDTGYAPALLQLSRKHELICLRLFHAAEATVGNLGLVPVLALETGKVRWVASGDRGLGMRLSDRFRQQGEELAQLCARYELGHLALDTSGDPLGQLERYVLTRRGRRLRAL